jgi:quercetin dioxygenase-like cupin family protein
MLITNNLPQKEIIKGLHVRFVHTENCTIGFFEIEEGAALPAHSHFHEQVSQVMEGRFQLTIGDETHIYEPGMVAVIPSNIVHSGLAITPCRVMDIFTPVREDYK